ncbi:TonB-dependent receptor plug domain-containing protein [Roseimarinus sediminis]|uniref:TonB-dependent receptor plug domain-containing protein n=1 Tax=Roseimarinus sediminis TaxID=1610899 RepID=UPI003D1F02E6
MQKSQKLIKYLFLSLFLLLTQKALPQQRISVDVADQQLSVVLNNIARDNSVRFAFDDDLLAQIRVTFQYNNIRLEQFLNQVAEHYGLKYRLIAGTYVFYVDDEVKITEAIQASLPTLPDSSQQVEVPVFTETENRILLMETIVKNKRTGEQLKYAIVRVNGVESGFTNDMGYFSFEALKHDTVKVSIERSGFLSSDTTLVPGENEFLVFELKPLPLLENLKGRSSRPVRFMIELPQVPDMMLIEARNNFQLPAVESNDLISSLTIIPGINYLKGTDTGLSIRGGAPSDNLVLLDGIPVFETNHLMGNLSILNAKYVQQVFVSRGGFGAEYGGRTSGIVDLSGKTVNSKVAEVDFTANLLHTNIYVGIPINEKSSLTGAFKKSFVDVWPQLLIDQFALENKILQVDGTETFNGTVDETLINYSDVNLKLSIHPTRRREINFNFFDSFDSQQRNYVFDDSETYFQKNNNKVRTTGYSFNLKNQSRNAWLHSLSAGYNSMSSFSQSEHGKEALIADQPVKNYFDADSENLQTLRMAWKSENRHRMFGHQLGAGYNYDAIDYRYENHEVKITGANNFNDSIASNASAGLVYGFYQLSLKPFPWLYLRGGTRGLYHINEEVFTVQPRFGLEVSSGDHLRFNYSTGRYVQHVYLTYRMDSYKNISSVWFIPEALNQNLDASHHVAGVKLEYSKFNLNVEGYLKQNRNKVYFIGTPEMQGGLNVVNYQDFSGVEINRGIDFFMQYRSKRFKHLLAYSLSESVEQINGINENRFFPSTDHQQHRLRLTEMYDWSGWTLSLNWHVASGLPYMKANSDQSQLLFGVLPYFSQLDASVVKQFDFKYFYADIGISILNILNRRNELWVHHYLLSEGPAQHQVSASTTATAFSPLFYVNLRYE